MENIEMFMVNEQLKCGSLILSTIWNKITKEDKLKKEFDSAATGYHFLLLDDCLSFEWILCNNNIRAAFDIERNCYEAGWSVVSSKEYGFLIEGGSFLYCRENETIQAVGKFLENIQKAIEYSKKNN